MSPEPESDSFKFARGGLSKCLIRVVILYVMITKICPMCERWHLEAVPRRTAAGKLWS